MFGFMSEVVSSVTNTVEDFIDEPVQTVVGIATQPVYDTLEVLEGLSEGELHTQAALRLGVDAVSGMAVSELIEVILEYY